MGSGEKLRVLAIAGELAPWKRGGIATVVRGLSNALARHAGVEVSLLGAVPRGEELSRGGYESRIVDLAVRESSLPQPFRRAAMQTGYLRQFRRWARTNSTSGSLVHAHLLPGFRLFPVLALALKMGYPVVQAVYDWLPMELHFYPRHRWVFRAHWLISQALLKRARVMCVNSRYIHEFAAAKWPEHEIHIIPNGVPDSLASGNKLDAPTTGPVTFFYWGELIPKKGPLVLVEAASRLRSLSPDLDFRVWIGGTGPQEQEVRDRVQRQALGDVVSLLGPLEPAELLRRLQGSHVVVLPSAYEGFGMAVLEAMAAGRPVITTDRGGVRDIITSPDQGVLVPRTGEAFAQAMASLATDIERRRAIGRGGRRRAGDFSWASIAEQYISLYGRVAAPPGYRT